MKNGNGGSPIPPIKPQRLQKEPTGRVMLQRPGPPPPPPRVLKHTDSASKKPTGIPPIPKKSTASAKRDSCSNGSNDFFREKPGPEPPSGTMPIELDVDVELADRNEPQTSFPSIIVDFDAPVSEVPASGEAPLAPFQETPGGKSGEYSILAQKLSLIVERMEPPFEGRNLVFAENGVFIGNVNVGTLAESPSGASIRIWVHKLGFGMESLPSSAMFALFTISDVFFADAKSRAGYVSIYAEHSMGKNSIKLCFHKEETPAAFLSVPFRVQLPEGR
jgi:hypothetical protein